jgi:hypothetical protein
MAWRSTLLSSVKRNSSLPNAKYVQLVRTYAAAPRPCGARKRRGVTRQPVLRHAQQATVRPNGRPANRSVVFRCVATAASLRCHAWRCLTRLAHRGFLDETDSVTFVTDARSQKARLLLQLPTTRSAEQHLPHAGA